MRGEGGVAGPMSTAVHRSPNKFWRSNSIFNLCSRLYFYLYLFFLGKISILDVFTWSHVQCTAKYSSFYTFIKNQVLLRRKVISHIM
jgi:hypothetical protein